MRWLEKGGGGSWVAGGRWLEGGGRRQVAGARWLEGGGRGSACKEGWWLRVGGWRVLVPLAGCGGWRAAGGGCMEAGGWWLEAGGCWQENGGVAGVVWWVFGMAYRCRAYATELRNTFQYMYR